MVFQALELVILVYDKYHALKSRQRAAISSYDNWHLNFDVLPGKKENIWYHMSYIVESNILKYYEVSKILLRYR